MAKAMRRAARVLPAPVTVTVTYNLQSNALVGLMANVLGALGYGSSFPTTLSATEIVMSE